MRQVVAPEMHFLLNISGYKWKIKNCHSIGLSESSSLGTDLGGGGGMLRFLPPLHIIICFLYTLSKNYYFKSLKKNFNALQRQIVNPLQVVSQI